MDARDLRLKADYESLQRLAEQSLGALEVADAVGRPPDQYIVIYRCRSIERVDNGKPVYSNLHRMRIRLPARYPLPSAPPRLEFLTPLFNPHVYPNLLVCLGAWQTAEYLDELVARVGALVQFDRRILNLRDPANPDAMEWVKKNFLLLPTDNKIFGSQDINYSYPDSIDFQNIDLVEPDQDIQDISVELDPNVAFKLGSEPLPDFDSLMEWIDT